MSNLMLEKSVWEYSEKSQQAVMLGGKILL